MRPLVSSRGTSAAFTGIEFPVSVVVLSGLALVGLLATIAFLTLGRSIQRYWRRQRRSAIRDGLRNDLLDGLYASDDPEWERWVSTLSRRERSVLESLLDEYLRELDGSDARVLADLGEALGIDSRARRRLETGGYYERLHALTWLTLLQDPPDPEVLETHCTGTPRERAAAARVLYASDRPDIASAGVELMLRESSEPFSIFGIDTLYRVAKADPSHLLDRTAADYTTWEPALQEQVLLVTRHVHTVVGTADLSWIVDLLSSPEERTRIEAARTLGGYGWRRSLRDQVDIEALCADPSPRVRASAYRMLGEWGDARAIAVLRAAAAAEQDDRARVAAAESLIEHRERYAFTVPETLAAAWEWATAHDTFDALARDVSSPRHNV